MRQIEKVRRAAQFVRDRLGTSLPRTACFAGSGLGSLASGLKRSISLPYEEIPHMPPVGVCGHEGRLSVGSMADDDGAPLLLFSGRAHLYEGRDSADAAFAVRLAAELGAEALILTNAAGGLNSRFRAGDLMLLRDLINLSFRSPLRGRNEPAWGPRFPDMSRPFDERLARVALDAARRDAIPLKEGVYAAVLGPNYETRAEIALLRALGADAVGMSTATETIVARHCGLRVLGLSVITNVCVSVQRPSATTHDEVLQVAAQTEPQCARLIAALARALASKPSF